MSKDLYRQNKDVIFREEEDEAIIFNPDNSDIVVINSTGCFIWSKCDGKNTREDLINNIIEEFDTTAEVAKKDLEQFLSDLEKRNFVEKI